MEILTDPIWLTTLGVLIGAIVGSFLNVCVTRIPKGLSIVFPSSSCPQCKTAIFWVDNVPLLSWIRLKGKARCCDFRIPWRYLAVEVFTALLFGFIFFKFGREADWGLMLCGIFFTSVIIIVISIDFETMMIPDRFSIGGAVVGLIMSFCFPSLHGFSIEPIFIERMSSLFISFMGLLVSSAVLYWIGAVAETLMDKEALGQGDIKLLGLVGSFRGWQGGLFVIFGGALVGTIFLIPILLITKYLKKEEVALEDEKVVWGMEIPFGPFLGIAALIYFLGLEIYVDAWFNGIFSNFIHFFSVL